MGSSGKINIGCILSLLIFVAAIIVAVNTAPVYINVGDLQKEIETQADRAGLPGYNNQAIKQRILQEAQSLDLPVTEDSITVERHGSTIDIVVEYDLVLDYGFYTYDWHKVHDVSRPIF